MQLWDLANNIQTAPLQEWFALRAGVLEDLVLPPIHGLPVAILEALGGSPAEPRLRRLAIDFMGDGSAEDAVELLSALSRAPRLAGKLETLSLINATGEMLHAAALGNVLHLPQLRAFHLGLAQSGEPTNPIFDVNEEFVDDALPEGLPQALWSCSKLEELVVVDTGTTSLRVLPACLSRLAGLRQLRLLWTGVEELPASVTVLSGLEHLQLVNQWPVEDLRLPPTLSTLSQLTRVELHCHEAPAALGTLPCLKCLTLRCLSFWLPNSDEEFARLLDGGLRLEELGLVHCRLMTLPAAVTRQARLRSLDLHECSLSELPAGPYLQQLQHLDLRQNRFSHVPAAALAAPRLQTLAMQAGEPPLAVGSLQGAELAAAVAALKAKFGPHGNVEGDHHIRDRQHQLEVCKLAEEVLIEATGLLL